MPRRDDLPPTLGPAVCRWIESYLVHGEGDYLGRPFRLERWQREIIFRLYEYDRRTRRRLVRRLLLILPKGNGKTELLAAICLAELAGPTAVGDDGRPTLRTSPNIPVAAGSREQANRLFGAARTMVEEGPLAGYLDTYQYVIERRDGAGSMTRVAAVDGTNDGGLPTAFAADEIHEWRTDRQRRVHLVIGNSLAKRSDGLELNISTPDAGDAGSLIGDLAEHGRRVQAGETDDPSFLFVWHRAGDGYDLDDPEALRAAIREANPASWIDVEAVAARYEVDRIAEHEFRRYHLGQFVRGGDRALPAGAWEALEDPSRSGRDDVPRVLAFDGSFSRDSTALVSVTVEDRPHVEVIGLWERPPMAGDGWRIPRDEVDGVVADAFARYDVVEFAADPAGWPSELQDWAERYGEAVVDFPQSQPRMGPATQRLYTAALGGDLTHDGTPALARHLSNVAQRYTRHGPLWSKPSKDSPLKIDAAIALVMAYERAAWRRDAETAPSLQPFALYG